LTDGSVMAEGLSNLNVINVYNLNCTITGKLILTAAHNSVVLSGYGSGCTSCSYVSE